MFEADRCSPVSRLGRREDASGQSRHRALSDPFRGEIREARCHTRVRRVRGRCIRHHAAEGTQSATLRHHFRHADEDGGLWDVEAVPDHGELIVIKQAELTSAGRTVPDVLLGVPPSRVGERRALR
ncbi:hypothetical protein [Streptomyces sp. AF1A]|uniref:hypothetical protein n=1 Tax=Streptomyces sp. AF1A TaxID=3394350 RepID=UPI0039BCA0F8